VQIVPLLAKWPQVWLVHGNRLEQFRFGIAT